MRSRSVTTSRVGAADRLRDVTEHRIASQVDEIDFTELACACGWSVTYAKPNPLYPPELQPVAVEADKRHALNLAMIHAVSESEADTRDFLAVRRLMIRK